MGCCGQQESTRTDCPDCGGRALTVAVRTLRHLLTHGARRELHEGPWYFCGAKGCATVYFDGDGQRFTAAALRTPVGRKEPGPEAPLCYCFDVSYGEVRAELARSGREHLRERIATLTRAGECACEVRNPSGRCCLADFPANST